MGQERVIHEMIGRMVYGAMVHGGPEYRELMEAFHILKHAYHAGKEFFEEMTGDGE